MCCMCVVSTVTVCNDVYSMPSGIDHAVKCGLLERAWCVVIGRAGFKAPPNCKATFIAQNDGDADVSSTRVRKALEQRDLATVRALLHPRVYEYLEEHNGDLFQ